MAFAELLASYEEEPLNRQLIISLLKEYKRPNDKINELVKEGALTAVKKGWYIPGPATKIKKPEPFLIANHLWGPSYISLESALSHWRLIPERVYEISSVTIKASKSYKTAVGRFSYFHAGLPYYAFGIQSVALTSRQVVLIASPEKALCDKIIMTAGVFLRSTRQTYQFLIEDMRMEEVDLRNLNLGAIRSWIPAAQKKNSLNMLIKTLEAL